MDSLRDGSCEAHTRALFGCSVTNELYKWRLEARIVIDLHLQET